MMRNLLLDAILFALFTAELSFHFLPKILHEILGVIMFALIICHVAINRRRFVSLVKKMTPRKFFSTTTNILLTICAGVTVITGVCMSNYLFVEAVSFELRRNMTIHQLHIAAPYVMMILIGVHVGLHWREPWQRFFKRFGIIFKAAAGLLAACGVAGFFLNRVGDRILMKHIFATPATELPAAIFILLIIGGIIFYALITFLLDEKFFKGGRG